MNPIASIFVCLALIAYSRADEPRIARFDVVRVFEQYQHTKDINAAISDKRHSRLPSDVNAVRECYEAAKKRVEDARAANDHTERAELQLRNATLNAQNLELQITVERLKRDKSLQDEASRQRAEILREIWAAARDLGNERGCHLLVLENLPSDLLHFTIVVTGATDDLTEPLLARLNAQYTAKKSK
jgi:Skp family chaperone for outer membrane proteins